MFSRKMMFKRSEQMKVAWSKVGAIWRILEDFPLEISQRLICLVGSMWTRVDAAKIYGEVEIQRHKFLTSIQMEVRGQVYVRTLWEETPGTHCTGGWVCRSA
jgi:hypothetical protein